MCGHRMMRIEPRSGFPANYGVILRPVKALVETGGYIPARPRVHAMLFRPGMQFQNLHAIEAPSLGEKPPQQWGNRVAVSRIEVEIPGADEYIIRVGSLKNGHPA